VSQTQIISAMMGAIAAGLVTFSMITAKQIRFGFRTGPMFVTRAENPILFWLYNALLVSGGIYAALPILGII
jgi:hypothetical protein